MEGQNRSVSSTSSFTSDLFGSKDSSSSSVSSASTGIFGAIFASNPPNMVVGRECLRSQPVEKKHNSASHAWNSKSGNPDSSSQNKQSESESRWKDNNPYYTEPNAQPCTLSSSIYYGGQDIYHSARQNQDYSTFTKDQGDDDSGSASRGNWWQGGLYY